MGIFEQFPYTNYHDLNLDWILIEIKKFAEELDDNRDDLISMHREITEMQDELAEFPETFSEEFTQEIYRILNEEWGDLLPHVTTDDDGRVLGVRDGIWATTTLPNGNLPAVTGVDDGKVLMVDNDWTVQPAYQSYNKYNAGAATPDVYISDTGAIVAYSGRTTSDYIYVAPGTYWVTAHINASTPDGFDYICTYDTNKTFIERERLTSDTVTISAAGYVRLWGSTSRMSEAMFVPGNTQPARYYPFEYKLPGSKLYDVDGKTIIDESIEMSKTSFVTTSENLINQMKVQKGYVVNTSGQIVENSGYAITAPMRLKPSTVYSYNTCTRISYFKEDGTYITQQGLATSQALTGSFTTLAAFDYVIISMYNTPVYGYNWQFVEGPTLPEYAPQHLIIDGYRIYDEPDSGMSPLDIIKAWDKIVVDGSSTYLLETDVDGLTTADRNTTAIYGAYDALLASNSEYITKTALGSDGAGTMLYRYDFKTPESSTGNPGVTVSEHRKTKIILISGVHPEFAGIYGLYHAMERITNDPRLADLKSQMHFIIMPVVNAYGCNNNQRKNRNGIDLARNFEVDFEPGTDPTSETYAGLTPLSEVEDQYVDAIMAANPDAIFFASCHNFQQAENWPNCAIWSAAATEYYTNISAKIIDKLTTAWKNKYNYTDTTFGHTERAAPNGSEGKQALKYGIQGGTFETCQYFKAADPNVFSSAAISRATEVYINMIQTAAACFNRLDKRLD